MRIQSPNSIFSVNLKFETGANKMASFCKSIYGMEKKFRSFTERFFTKKKRIKMRGKIKFTTKIRSIAGTIVKYIFKNYNMI